MQFKQGANTILYSLLMMIALLLRVDYLAVPPSLTAALPQVLTSGDCRL